MLEHKYLTSFARGGKRPIGAIFGTLILIFNNILKFYIDYSIIRIILLISDIFPSSNHWCAEKKIHFHICGGQVKKARGKQLGWLKHETCHSLPVKAIHLAYFVASRRQCEATSRPQVTVREMMPMMIKKSVVTHSGGSRGGMQVRSRPWMVWHWRTSPTVRAPGIKDNNVNDVRVPFNPHKLAGSAL